LVVCSEGPEGGGLDEALVKLVTGGDPISARFLNREFFTFKPMFKLWMLTNHKPRVRT
jgi:putative DNA primase/helicase